MLETRGEWGLKPGRVGVLEGGVRLSGKQERSSHTLQYNHLVRVRLCAVYELACAYSTQAFFFFFFLKRDLLIQLFLGSPPPEPLSDP